ncbi:MAG: condensation domain-containing protein, partial [Candidatus Acidiferrum sp.]
MALKNERAGIDSGAMGQPIPRCPDEALVLSFGQERLWFLQLLEPRSAAYNISCAFRLVGTLDTNRLVHAYHVAVARQEVLRTCILNENGRPVAVLSSEIPAMHVVEVSHGEDELQHLLSTEARRPFALDREPMIRATLYRMRAEQHVLALTLHHSAADGWSVSALLKDIVHAYGALAQDAAYQLPKLPIRYADYAAWQRKYLSGESLRAEIDFWKQHIGSTPLILELPTDFPRPPSQSYRGAIDPPFLVESTLMQRVREFARKQRITLFSVLMAAYELLISRYSGQQQFTVGVPVAGRGRPELDQLCGFFANTLVIPCAVNQQWNFHELANHIQQQVSAALAHPDVPFEKLVEELKPERDTSRSPLFQALFAYEQFSKLDLSVHGIQSSPLPVNTGAAKFDLSFYLGDDGSQVELSVEYSTDLFRASTIARMLQHYSALLEQLVDHPQRSLGQVPLLTSEEQQQILHSFNDTAMDYPQQVSLVELFEMQVAKSPDATAVVFGEHALAYRELNQ